AALAKTELGGTAQLHLAVVSEGTNRRLTLDGQLDTRGRTVPARLLGRARLALSATLNGADVDASRLQLHGAAIDADLDGHLRKGGLGYRLALDLKDLSRLAATVRGTLALRGSVNGPLDNAVLSAGGNAVLATQGFARQRVTIDLKASGLPALREASLAMDGR